MRVLMIPVMSVVIGAFLASEVAAQVSPLRLAVLPSARSGQVGETLTFLGTIINTGETDLACREAIGNVQAGDELVSIGVIPIDEEGVPVSFDGLRWPLPAGATQRLLITSATAAPTAGRARTRIRCITPSDSGAPTLRPIALPGVNDFGVNFTADPQADIIMIGDTITGDGVARVGATGPRAALLTTAAVNIGAPAQDVLVRPDILTFSRLRALPLTVCETDAAGICLAPEADQVVIDDWASDEIRFFAVRLRVPGGFGIPFNPGELRLALYAMLPDSAAAGSDVADESIAEFGPVVAGYQSFGAGTSAAVEVQVQEDATPFFDGIDGTVNDNGIMFGCRARGDDELETRHNQFGANRGLFSPDGHGGAALGFERGPGARFQIIGYTGDGRPQSNGLSDYYLTSFSLIGEGDWPASGLTAIIPATLTVHGNGDPLGVTADGTQSVAVTFDLPTGGLSFSFPGDPGMFNSVFGAPGRVRCAPIPARPGETGNPDPGIGDYLEIDPVDFEEERDAEIRNDELIERIRLSSYNAAQELQESLSWAPGGSDDHVAAVIAGFVDLAAGQVGGSRAIHSDGPESITEADAMPDGFAYYERLDEGSGGATAGCVFVVLADTISPEEEATEIERAQDARIMLLTRKGTSQGLAQDIRDCIP